MNKKKLIRKCQNPSGPIKQNEDKKLIDKIQYSKKYYQALAMLRAMQAGFSSNPFQHYGDSITANQIQNYVKDNFKSIDNDYLNIYTYLFNKADQAEAFYNNGYIPGLPNDYGLVSESIGKRKLPVYQMYQDEASEDQLEMIGNFMFNDNHAEYIPGLNKKHRGNRKVDLQGHPVAVYKHKDTGDIYAKAWDLTDFGDKYSTGGHTYSGIYRAGANFLDLIGNSNVITTGFIKVDNPEQVLYYLQD